MFCFFYSLVRQVSHNLVDFMTSLLARISLTENESQVKDERRKNILVTGELLFLERGISNVDMKEIAQKAGIGRATLYRYFKSKKDIALEIFKLMYGHYIQPELIKQSKSITGTGLEKIKKAIAISIKTLQKYPEVMRFIVLIEYYFTMEDETKEIGTLFSSLQIKTGNIWLMEQFIIEGINDGSLRKELDPKLTSIVIIQAILNMLHYISFTSRILSYEYNIKKPALLLPALEDIIIEGIKNK